MNSSQMVGSEASLVPNSQTWRYEDWFEPPASTPQPVIEQAEAYVKQVKLEGHRFFDVARRSVDALLLWTRQELIMTGPFSCIVLRAASLITNVHIRSVLSEVAFGEHGSLEGVFSPKAHPWLLHLLAQSLKISPESVVPLPETEAFLGGLASELGHPLSAIAAIGVGNERLIIPEYSAIKRCFRALMPNTNFAPFLDANLQEDIEHTRLCSLAAASLMKTPQDEKLYLEAAKRSVDRRVSYFDALHLRCSRF